MLGGLVCQVNSDTLATGEMTNCGRDLFSSGKSIKTLLGTLKI